MSIKEQTIKEQIGQRIKTARTTKGLTRKALAQLTHDLNVSRINNYERGERTPGPLEIKQLAQALDVPAAFLMCLSDEKQSALKKASSFATLVPLLNEKQAAEPKTVIQQLKAEQDPLAVDFIPLSLMMSDGVSDEAFAFTVNDDSMAPELRIGDVLIIDPVVVPKPADLVVAKLDGQDTVIVRKYKPLSAFNATSEVELIALNNDWPVIRMNEERVGTIIGTVISFYRTIKKAR